MKLLHKRWVNWDKNFLEGVKEEASKDEDYKEAMKIHTTPSVKKKGCCITVQDYGSHVALEQVS
jgi:hypothetical protein